MIIDTAKAIANKEDRELGQWVGRFLIAQKNI
jgi:hypothetical protein